MVQIARRRKKGRPSKADLARRSGHPPAAAAASQSDTRRSLRRRSVRYNIIDYEGDYLDDEEDERKREKKKLKLMAKLNQDGQEEKLVEEFHDDQNEQEEDKEEDEDGVVKGRKVESKGLHSVSVSGTPVILQSGIPLPDMRTLELILDKLQKKDTYGVFAEPVDPEELPDYHDVIEHPMDFATVRKKLAKGSYTTLEQFESDIFLICSNAMQYNAPETIYHKQARSIQELGRKKFEKLRVGFERSQVELTSDQKAGSNHLVKKQQKNPLAHASQEPVGSDFSAGATLANIADIQPNSHLMQGVRCERPDIIHSILESNAFWIDSNQEKVEDVLSGKGLLSKWGRKPFVLDESRRASYSMPYSPIARSDSVFMTFDSEMKNLVTVGLHAEYSYARSLARFSASLGPIAWKIASHRIQQVLPPGIKYGCGWVGEYESLPTPMLMVNDHVKKGTSLVMKLHSTSDLSKGDKNCKNVEPNTEHPVNGRVLDSAGKHFFGSAGVRLSAPANIQNQEQNAQYRKLGNSENKGLKQVELNSLPSANQNNNGLVAKFTGNSPAAEPKSREMVPRSMFNQPNTNGIVSGELPNGRVTNTCLNRQVTDTLPESTSNQSSRTAPVVHGQEQGFGDPVQLMRMFSERAQKQQTSSSHSLVNNPPVTRSCPSGQRDDSGNASAAAACVWMSAGAGGFKKGPPDNSSSPKNQISTDPLYNSSREFHQHISRIRREVPAGGMPFQPFQALAPQPIHAGAVSQFPNRPMVFPQSASADQSRFQMQSSWRGLSPLNQSRQKQETLPPDLNIGFQSPGSPAKQTSGVLVDSQQPDLALQL